jgi:hypothetical protein
MLRAILISFCLLSSAAFAEDTAIQAKPLPWKTPSPTVVSSSGGLQTPSHFFPLGQRMGKVADHMVHPPMPLQAKFSPHAIVNKSKPAATPAASPQMTQEQAKQILEMFQ